MGTRETLIKLNIKAASASAVFLKTRLLEEGKEGFELTLTDGKNVWKGLVDPEEMDDMKDKTKMNFENFVKQTAIAFTQEGDSVDMFQYAATRKKECVILTWKKHIPSEDITFELGSVTLGEVKNPQEELCHLLSYCINSTFELQTCIQTMEKENERLSMDRANALKRLQKCVDMKEEFEEDMYAKFVAVLNAKKEKIRNLKANFDGRIEQDSEPKPSTSKGKGTKTKRKTESAGSIENNSEDLFADEEDSPVSKRSKRGAHTTEVCSSNEDNEDDSLVLDDSDVSPGSMKVATRPTRQKRGNTKQTPSKPLLPKVITKQGQKTPTSSKAPSPRKSTSKTSRSSADIDADDLLEQICS